MITELPDHLPAVCGVDVDPQTRCAHWHSALDIVAIKMRCCGVYWACKDCHIALAGHAIAVWGREGWDARAVLCGACGVEMTIREYMECEARCPSCAAAFNPGCRKHYHFYFEAEEETKPEERKILTQRSRRSARGVR